MPRGRTPSLTAQRQQQICERLFKALTDKTDRAACGARPPWPPCAPWPNATDRGSHCSDRCVPQAEPSFLMPPAADALKAETGDRHLRMRA